VSAPAMTSADKARIMGRLLLLQAAWDPMRLQAAGLAWALDPWLVRVWGGDPAALRAARARHAACFNTHPYAAWLVAGALCTLEAQAAGARGSSREHAIKRVDALKSQIACTLAGIYDSFFWGALRAATLVAGFGVAWAAGRLDAAGPALWGASSAVLLFAAAGLAARVRGFRRGLADGDKAALALSKFPVQRLALALRRGAAAAVALGFAGFFLGSAPAAWKLGGAAVLGGALALSYIGLRPLPQTVLAAAFMSLFSGLQWGFR